MESLTKPYTDLQQQTYYLFRNDNTSVFQTETEDEFFSFTFKIDFESKHRFDQCSIAIYLDSGNWVMVTIE